MIDLPGIVGASVAGEPTDMMIQTRELVESYINDPKNPHCLIVCVVSSRTERIRNSQAMEMIQRYNKHNTTIGVLTMIDLCKDTFRNTNDPFWELKERLNGTSQDMPNLDFGYVALKNRDTIQKHNLADVNISEYDWLTTNIPEMEHLLTSNDESSNAIGIDALIKKILNFLDIYVLEKWSTKEMERLQLETSNTRQEYYNLGRILNGHALCDIILNKIKLNFIPSYSYETIKKLCDTITLPQITAAPLSEEYFQQKINMFVKAKNIISSFLEQCLIKPISTAMNNIFTDKIINSYTTSNQLSRYSIFRSLLEETLLAWAMEMKCNLMEKINNKLPDLLMICNLKFSIKNPHFDYYAQQQRQASYSYNLNSSNKPESEESKYMKQYIFEIVYTELLMKPVYKFLTKQSLQEQTQQSNYNHIFNIEFKQHVTEFRNHLIQAFASKESCDDIDTASTTLFVEDCAGLRKQICYKYKTLKAMIGAIKSEFPSTDTKSTDDDDDEEEEKDELDC